MNPGPQIPPEATSAAAPVVRVLSKNSFKGSAEDLQELFVLRKGFEEMERLVSMMLAASNKINWVDTSPDGLVGGRGFIMPVEDLQGNLDSLRRLSQKCKSSVYDECFNNPHWNAVKEELKRTRGTILAAPPDEPIDPEPPELDTEDSSGGRFDEIDFEFDVDA